MPAAIAAIITVLLTICQLSPEHRDDAETCYAKSRVCHEIDSKNGAKHCNTNAAGNGYQLTDSSLAQMAPSLFDHQ
jgi:hypothetical protein